MQWWHFLLLLVFWQGIVWPLVRRHRRKRKGGEDFNWLEQGPSRKHAGPSEEGSSGGLPEAKVGSPETYGQKLALIPEKFATVPEGYTVEHLTWKEYEATGLNEGIDLAEVMRPRDLTKVLFDVLRDPDGNIVAERDQSGGRWWTPEEKEAEERAWQEFEDGF